MRGAKKRKSQRYGGDGDVLCRCHGDTVENSLRQQQQRERHPARELHGAPNAAKHGAPALVSALLFEVLGMSKPFAQFSVSNFRAGAFVGTSVSRRHGQIPDKPRQDRGEAEAAARTRPLVISSPLTGVVET
ncbi:hypothetical protein ROHU_020740 [Labeo rohita]|uniref:Uncharacterized protein n=1 Tax=Labeo rohita TaxID=84645 RepID=A0A498N0F1_LABRO|nr:hypothetical protein ROHU_020740 [Labeo rohita]